MEPMDKVILQPREPPSTVQEQQQQQQQQQQHQKTPPGGDTTHDHDDEGILKDFLRNSSLPVARYVLGTSWCVSLKVFWWGVSVCLIGVVGFTVAICMERLRDPSNVFVGEAEKPLPIWTIPFPAVTLCPRKEGCVSEQSPLLPQICESICWEDLCTNDCDRYLDPVRTVEGICYTFNAVAGAELFNNNSLSNVLHLSNVSRRTENWDFLRGRQIMSSVLVKQYPRAAQDVSGRYRLRMFFRSGFNESTFDCTTPSLDAFVHSPMDFPYQPSTPIVIPAGPALVQVSVYPKLVRSQRYLRYFSSSTTGCISQTQNPLTLFTVYSQVNCETECMVNFYLQIRGCVLDYMPRARDVKLCNETVSPRSINFFNKNVQAQLRAESIPRSQYFRWKCNCLPACVEYRYRTEVNRFSLDFLAAATTPSNASEQLSAQQLTVEFPEDHFYPLVRVVRYGLVDLLADCGGLIALFLGVSIVSLLEIFFFCLVKPAVMR